MFDEARAEIYSIAYPVEALPPDAIFLLGAINESEGEKTGFRKVPPSPPGFTIANASAR